MDVVAPITVTNGGTLTSSNASSAGDPAAYNPGTGYTTGQRCVESDTIWQSALVGANTGNLPSTSPSTTWAEVGPINKMAMFDRRISSLTVNADTIDVTITPGAYVSHLMLRNVTA